MKLFARRISNFIGIPLILSAFLLSGCHHGVIVEKPVVTLDQVRAKLYDRLRVQGVKVLLKGETVTLILPSVELFAGRTQFIAPTYVPILDTVVFLMRTYSITSARVNAYTAKPARALTRKQSRSVVKYLTEQGVNVRLLVGDGKSNQNKVAWNGTAKGRIVNMRVSIHFRYYPRVNTTF